MTELANEKIAKLNENKKEVAQKIPSIRKKFIGNKSELKSKVKVK